MTNFERIKKMSVEDLAEFIMDYDCEWDCWRVMGISKGFPESQKQEALKAQIAWLESEGADDEENY